MANLRYKIGASWAAEVILLLLCGLIFMGFVLKKQATFKTHTFSINAAIATDDFLLWKTPVAITITDIHGVLQSGTNVVGGLDECDSAGVNAVAVDSDITFDGGSDADDGSLTNGSIDANDWVKWHTTTVNAPGYLTVTVFYVID